jgi:hypothetical protein
MTLTDDRLSHKSRDNQTTLAEPVRTSPQAKAQTSPEVSPPAGDQPASSQHLLDPQGDPAAGSETDSQSSSAAQRSTAVGPDFPAGHAGRDAHGDRVGGEQTEDGSAATNVVPHPNSGPSLADPYLALMADVLDDAESTRIANENRLRALTRAETDSDGEERGYGLLDDDPVVVRLTRLVDGLAAIEHQAALDLNRLMRQHPLGAWGKAQKGVGEKQLARLLAVVGDPYWNTLHDRPRTVSELWAYCGYHVLPAGQMSNGHQASPASEDSSSAGGDPGHRTIDVQRTCAGVAARRRKGQKANWSTTAKTRAYLIAESMLRAGNRETYDKRKASTEGRAHASECVRCGPKGKPALPGTPWSDGHRHADALRITAKELLKDLWREAKRFHEEASGPGREN